MTQHLAYHGMRYVRHLVASLVPEGKTYVEPFAGHAWVAREVCRGERKCILGDRDSKPLEWVKRMHKPVAEMKVADWKETVRECDGKCFYLMDPPHGMLASGASCTGRHGCDTDRDYFPEVIEFCRRHECLINIPFARKEELCKDIVCHEFIIKQARNVFRYVIGDTRKGAKPIRWSGTFEETKRKG